MKRVFAALLALVMCLSLCACGGLGKVELPPVPTAETVVVPTEAPQETETPDADPHLQLRDPRGHR